MYIYAKGLEVTHLRCSLNSCFRPKLAVGRSGTRFFYRRLPKPDRRHYLDSQDNNKITPLMGTAVCEDLEGMYIWIRAGTNLEVCHRTHGTALIMVCRASRLHSVKLLVRHGAKLECSMNGTQMYALHVARDHPDVLSWFLVERWTDQGKLTNNAFNLKKDTKQRPRSGVRTVGVPLHGTYERPYERSLMEHAKYLYGTTKDEWRFLLPLGWNTVAHFIPLPEELSSIA